MATVKEFVRKPSSELHGPAHPCDAHGLSPKEFLLAIMHDPSLPIQTRVNAAAELLPLTEPRPTSQGPTIKIIIGGISAEAPGEIVENSESKSSSRSYNLRPFQTTPGQSYIEKTLESLSLSEIIQITANCPEHLLPTCACGHKMMFPCSPPCSSRDPSKMN
jgi:hypothetical protein